MRRLAVWSLAALAATATIAACFSEHSDGTGPTGGTCGIPLDPSVVGTTIIAINNFSYVPVTTTVPAGTTVTWANCEPAGTEAHTVTADQGAFDSPLFQTGEFFQQTFAQAGSFTYHCEVHPSMTASLIVQ